MVDPVDKKPFTQEPGVRKVRINHLRKEATLVVRQDAEIDNAMIARALAAVEHTGHIKAP